MFDTTLIMAAGSLFAFSLAAPLGSRATVANSITTRNNQVVFGGDGSTNQGWPMKSQWMPFVHAWNSNLNLIQQSCQTYGWGQNNDATEVEAIHDAITSEASSSGIPAEFILAIMMQESRGCVRAPTTSFGFPNPGLMQSAGTASCNSGASMYPCPTSMIHAMIHEGTAGQGLRINLLSSLQYFESSGYNDDSKWYKTARRYNAGPSMDPNNLGTGPSPCYASDIANRLVQPFGDSTCASSAVSSVNKSSANVTKSDQNNTTVNNKNTATANKVVISSMETQEINLGPNQSQTNRQLKYTSPIQNGGQGQINGPSQSISQNAAVNNQGVSSVGGCSVSWTPKTGDSCTSSGLDVTAFRRLNPQVDAQCVNIVPGSSYCVGG